VPQAHVSGVEGFKVQSQEPQPPVTYTPSHLAERIRAVTVTDGERKTITALFADLKGSTALIEGLDPEEARTILDPALQLMMDAVHQYDGFVAQALGDGIFALFGAPLAHEDHPQRAVYAALRMQESMRRYGDALRGKGYPPLLMRVGLNTGEVVLRSIRKDDLHADYVPVGHSTNLAARMEQLANPGTVVVSSYTHRLTDGYFAFKDLGATQIKGVEEPLHIYEVLATGPLRTRLQVSASRYGLTRFVGRQSELFQLTKALEHARAGQGQIVGVMGEPGLGKSRLFHEFVGAQHAAPLRVLHAYSVSHGKATAYLPVIELLKSYFDIQAQDDERKRREKVGGKVLMLDRSLEDTLPYLFALLGIEEQPSPLQQMDAQIRRKRTFEALKKLFLRESLNQPLVLIFEDLHWIDGETQGFLDVLSESLASAKILLLTNYRQEYRPEWGQKTYYTQLRLAPFGKAEAEEFLDSLLSDIGSPLPRRERDRERVPDNNLHALKHLILAKTQGTPFFMEEIVQELYEQGIFVRDGVGAQHAAPLPTDLHIPPTVQGILAARIDRLTPDEKALLQQLSVIGRRFPLSLIRQVIAQPEADLYRLLASLQHKEFLYEQPAFPESEYIFKHALTQEVAYGTVLQEQRKVLHEKTARALEVLYEAKLEDHYSELAHHYSRSGNTRKAVEYLHLVGQQAAQRSAHIEAVQYLTVALELLKTLPPTFERTQQELTLSLLLGGSLFVTKGYAAPELGVTYNRARELCQQVGEAPQLFAALWGLWLFYNVRAEYKTGRELGEQLFRLARDLQDSALLSYAHYALGMSFFPLGQFTLAREHLGRAVTHHNLQKHRSLVFLYGQDPGVTSLSFLAWILWMQGCPDQALKKIHEALALAQELAHPYSLSFALVNASWLHRHRREVQEVQDYTKALIPLSDENGFSLFRAIGAAHQGWATIVQSPNEKGIAQIRQSLAALTATGARTFESDYLALLAKSYGVMGWEERGRRVLTEAFKRINKTGECWYEAELYRIKGELTLQKSEVRGPKSEVSRSQSLDPKAQSEAEACFLKSIAIAQKQQAKSLELRAVMSLVRLRQQQALEYESRNTDHVTRTRLDEAHRMLSEIYNWFTEGFDTKDLQEAKGLLEELRERTS
jgi:class 3 adenylate cyclase/predicted ATPase